MNDEKSDHELDSRTSTTIEAAQMKCYLFDIDGTIANLSHRLPHIQKEPKDWNSFFEACTEDAPIPHMVEIANRLAGHCEIVYVSGRSDQVRSSTVWWLATHGLPSGKLYMRKAGDHRPDYQVKNILLAQILDDGYEPIMAFDDRDQVVEMWRDSGIPCAQVAPGDF